MEVCGYTDPIAVPRENLVRFASTRLEDDESAVQIRGIPLRLLKVSKPLALVAQSRV